MKAAELLPSVFMVFCLSAFLWVLVVLVQKAHKPEVEGSSPSLTTTLLKNNQTQQSTVYTLTSSLALSSFLTKKQSAVISYISLFSSFLPLFEEFYCRVTAESVTSFLTPNPYHIYKPP